MRTFTFRVDQPDNDPVLRTRQLADDTEARAYARQLLADWPDCLAVEVRQADELIDRLRRLPT